MLHGLGHDALVQSDHQKHQVDASDARQHVFNKFFVARHVDDADVKPLVIGKVGESQLNGDPPLLLFPQPVGLDPCQRLDETRFSMIHVTGSSYNDVLHSAVTLLNLLLPGRPQIKQRWQQSRFPLLLWSLQKGAPYRGLPGRSPASQPF